MTPEAIAYVVQRLIDGEQQQTASTGQVKAFKALDAWVTPIHMKKGRPAVTLSVLSRPGDAADARPPYGVGNEDPRKEMTAKLTEELS